MITATLPLEIASSIQWTHFPYRNLDSPQMIEAPASILEKCLNGPASAGVFNIPGLRFRWDDRWISCGSLPAVAVFWFLLGLALEYGLNQRKLLVRTRLRLLVFLPAFATCMLALWGGFAFLHTHQMLPGQKVFRAFVPGVGWWSPYLSVYPLLIWFLVGAVYFGRKVWRTLDFLTQPKQKGPAHELLSSD